MSTIATSWPARARRSASPAPTRPQPMITARTACSTSTHVVARSLGRLAIAARPVSEAPACGQAGRGCGRRRGHLLGRWNGHQVGRRNLLACHDDLAWRVLEDVWNRGTDRKVAAEALAIGQAQDDRVGTDLDRLVDQRGGNLTCLEEVADQLDVVFLG